MFEIYAYGNVDTLTGVFNAIAAIMGGDDSGEATTLFFTLQVSDRVHLAHILRSVRRIPEVVRITRYVETKP